MKLPGKLAAIAFATSLLPVSAYAGAESGVYLGGGIGGTSVEIQDTDTSIESDETGFKLILGYNFGIIPLLDLAIEGAYVNFGKSEQGNTEFKQSAWDGFGLVGLSLGPVGLFGKLGMAAWENELSIGSVSTKTSGTDPVYGIGARLQIMKVTGRIEYEYYDLEGIDDTSMTSLSLLYTF
jgi:opacity protein-like surface antigen